MNRRLQMAGCQHRKECLNGNRNDYDDYGTYWNCSGGKSSTFTSGKIQKTEEKTDGRDMGRSIKK